MAPRTRKRLRAEEADPAAAAASAPAERRRTRSTAPAATGTGNACGRPAKLPGKEEAAAHTDESSASEDEVEETIEQGTAAHANRSSDEAAAQSEGDTSDDALPVEDSDSGQEMTAELDVFDTATAAAVERLGPVVADPAALAEPSAEVSDTARVALKALFDFTAACNTGPDTAAAGQSLDSAATLYVEGFDAEQIWAQLEMQSEPLLRRARRLIKKMGDEPQLLSKEMDEALGGLLGDTDSDGEDRSEDDLDDRDLTDQDGLGSEDTDEDEDRDREESESDEDLEGVPPGRKRQRAERAAKLPTEDRFLNLDDMERFVQDAEAAAARDSEGDDDADFGDDGENAGGEEYEDSEDEQLAALLENTSRLAGRKSGPAKAGNMNKRQRAAGSSEEEEEDEEEADMYATYEDFFGGRGRARDEEQDADYGQDMDEEEAIGEEDNEDFLNEDRDQSDDGLDVGQLKSKLPDSEHRESGAREGLSAHEVRMERMKARIERLEEENMGERDWVMRGESKAAGRPLNSALEVDLDFETSIRPPPQPTQETTASLEELIRSRVAEGRWDDVVRLAVPLPEREKVAVELDDKKSGKGLGEIYEAEYLRAAAGGTAEDKDDKVRAEARALMAELFARLDALSHFQFRPAPVVQELEVKADVPAIAMEEVAPQFVSEVSMRRPEEVKAPAKGAAPLRSQEELSREERRQLRAQKKRAAKKRRAQQDAERESKGVTEGGLAPIKGRRSEKESAQGGKPSRKTSSAQALGTTVAEPKRGQFSKSATVFARLQEQREAAAAGLKVHKAPQQATQASGFKL